MAYWTALEASRRAIVEEIVRDAGHTVDDAPEALKLAAEGAAQAALLRDSAYERIIESGGPMTSSGRTRRCKVWLESLDRLEKHLRLVGLKRATRRLNIAQQFAEHHAQREGGKK